MKVTRMALSALMALSGAVVIAGAGATIAPAARAATTPCGPTPSSGYVVSDVATGLDDPVSVAADSAGNVYVGEDGTGRALKLTPSGADYGRTVLPDSYNGPLGIEVDDNGVVWVTEARNNQVDRLTPSGSTYVHEDVTWGVFYPAALAVDSAGIPYVSAMLDNRIERLTPNGTEQWDQTVVTTGGGGTSGVAIGADDTVYSSFEPGAVVRSTPAGASWTDTTIPTSGLSAPRGLDVDADDVVYLADSGNDRIVVLTPSGPDWTQAALPVAGLDDPTDVAVGEAGVLYVADSGNDRVLKLSPAGVDAVADTAGTTAGDAVTTDVRANDTATRATLADPTIAKNPAYGTATVNANGTITYAPAAGFSGTDSYTYAVRDTTGTACATAKVTVTVSQGNACDPLGTSGATTRLPIETGTDYPNHYDVDADGSILVTDSEEGQIVRLTPSASGYDRSIVATGVGNVTAIAIDDSHDDGVLWVVRYPGQVLKLTPSGAGYTIADTYSGGLLDNIGGIDVAPDGDLFVSTNATSFGSGGVVRLATGSGMAQTLVISGLDVPHQVAVDDDGAVYVASYTRVVKAVDNGSGWTSTDVVTGLGSGSGVAVDSTGRLWVSTTEDRGLWTATPSGSGYAAKELYEPWGEEYATTLVVTDDDTVYVSDFERLWHFGPATVRAVDDTATVTAPQTVVTDVRANDPANTRLGAPTVIDQPTHGSATVNADGTISYTPDGGYSGTDSYDYEVRGESPAGTCSIATVTVTVADATACGATPSSSYAYRIPGTTGLSEPTGIAADANNIIYISDVGTGGNGGVIGWGPGSGPSTIDSTAGLDPQGIAVDADRNVYYADEDEHEIVKLTWTGDDYTRSVLASGLQRPSGVAVDADGNVYFAENSSGHVHKLTPSGSGYTKSLVGSGYERLRGVAVDADGNVYAADWADDDRIVKLSPSGASYTESVVSLSVENPYGVAVESDGTVVVGDSGNNRVLRLVPDGSGYRQETISIWGDHVPTWVATTALGAILVVDQDTAEVVILGQAGIELVDDTASATAPTGVTTDVRANDNLPAGTPLDNPTVAVPPAGGTATVNPDATITYTPTAGFSGSDSYSYETRIKVKDTMSLPGGITGVVDLDICDAATVTVTVANVFTPGPGLTTPQNTPVQTPLEEIATTTGKPLSVVGVTSVTGPDHGSIAIWPNGSVLYSPDPGYSGPDSYVVNVCDTATPQQCADITVPVTVGTNTVTAVDDTATTSVDQPVLTDVADNDTSGTGQPLADPTIATAATHGTAVTGSGGITYSPAAGFSGTDSYAYRICDTSTPTPFCDTATVTVTVTTTPGPTTGPAIAVTAPSKATLKLTKAGQARPLALAGQVTITGLEARARRTTGGTATLYGPVKKPTADMCTSANAVGTVAFSPANGTTPVPAVAVTRPGYYTWVASTGADAGNLAATSSCGQPAATTLVHRPTLGRVEVSTGYSGVRADDSAAGRRIRPVKVTVPAVGLRAKVETVGLRKDSMRIPTDITKGGWLNRSAAPGESVGSTVIAGHVSDRGDRPGAFGKLRKARPGQVITVRTAAGKPQRYRIQTISTQPRATGLAGAMVSTTGEHQLTLVTCTGRVTYRNGRFHYTKNLVVTATPIG